MPILPHLRNRLHRWTLNPTSRWVLMAGMVGGICGVAGGLFQAMVDAVSWLVMHQTVGLPAMLVDQRAGGQSAQDAVFPWIPALLIIPVLFAAGCFVGWLGIRCTRMVLGGGTGLAVEAFHRGQGALSGKAGIWKFLASVVTLGCGGSGGREGPIVFIGASFASWCARRLGTTTYDRRILLGAGIAGGISAVFHAPLAAVLFAAEILYRGPDLEAAVLIPGFVAAIVAFCVASGVEAGVSLLTGWPAGHGATLFRAPIGLGFSADSWPSLAGFTIMAILLALCARWFIAALAAIRERQVRWPVPVWMRPGVGMASAGMVALAVGAAIWSIMPPGVHTHAALGTIGGGYSIIHWFMADGGAGTAALWLALLLAVLGLGKILTTALTVGSGGSGGLFAPSIVIGGCLGGSVCLVLAGLPIAPTPQAGVVIGMAAMLAATHRTPVAAILLVSEIVGTYDLLVPAMWTCGLAFLLMGRRSIIPAQVDSQADSPVHQAPGDWGRSSRLRLDEVPGLIEMVPAVPHDAHLDEIRLAFSREQVDALAIVDGAGVLHGVILLRELVAVGGEPALEDLLRADDLAAGRQIGLTGATLVNRAWQLFREQHVTAWPVVDDDGRYLGMVRQERILTQHQAGMPSRPGSGPLAVV
ncbi:MAG: chloride channel protein [Planctomycetes bacterium]|nr:chloride channel protein [Planctomycetota bacterium]